MSNYTDIGYSHHVSALLHLCGYLTILIMGCSSQALQLGATMLLSPFEA